MFLSKPKPKHLSKTASEEKNDPLYAESYFTDESQALAPDPDLREIHSGLEGLDILLDSIFSYCVSKSTVFAYYCSIYSYARMLDLQQSNFRGLTFDEKEFLPKVKEFDSPIPKALATVLAGLGNTTCPNGRDLKFRHLPRQYVEGEFNNVDIPGYFGEASPLTQPVYKAYPCIAVYAQRILADLHGAENWDLPDNIRPNDGNAIHPNPNLMGYKPSVNLTNEQIAFLSKVGITHNNFSFNNGSLALNIPLILAVQRELAEVKGINFCPFPNISVGSTGQLAFFECTAAVLPGIDTDEHQILRSFCKISNPVAFVSTCAKYRTIYDPGEVVDDIIMVNWCIYDYVNDEIPMAYNDHVNLLRDGEITINQSSFRTGSFPDWNTNRHICRKDLVRDVGQPNRRPSPYIARHP